MAELGPRHENLLDAWASTVATTPEGEHYDFTAPTRTDLLRDRVDRFLDAPSEETFEAVWSPDVLRNAAYGGSGAVLNNWGGTIEDLADFVRTVRDVDPYDPAWERRVPDFVAPGLWELYGRLNPAERPILDSWVRKALPTFGLANPQSYADGAERLDSFRTEYERLVGHATAGTDHAVPIYDEIEQFLYLVATLDEEGLRTTLDMTAPTYDTFAGWDAMRAHGDAIELTGLTGVLDAFTTATNSDAYEEGTPIEGWGANHWETWKNEYRTYLEDEVFPTYDPTALEAGDVEPFVDALAVAHPLSDVIPIYLLGGRWQPWDNFETISADDPDEAARVLSGLLDEDGGPITERLGRFNDFYSGVSDSGGERMSLATMLLMLVRPDRYVMYRYSMFEDFFSAFSDYDVPTGFDPSAYALMNETLGRVRADLDTYVEDDVRMLDVHSLLWVYHRVGPP